ncbi:hypothetical protein ACQP0I_03890 [Micromonospora carbonacea]|uniref:hypothetical protein n=1 Tax=Micromonospora carbonacea TaxID=47853 RepID=UPI003D95CD82
MITIGVVEMNLEMYFIPDFREKIVIVVQLPPCVKERKLAEICPRIAKRAQGGKRKLV